MKTRNHTSDALKTGEITLESLLKVSEEKILLKIFYQHAIKLLTGEKIKPPNPLVIEFKPQMKAELYGNTLLKEYAHPVTQLRKKRIIQHQGVLFINSNIIYEFEGRNFDLSREVGLLVLS